MGRDRQHNCAGRVKRRDEWHAKKAARKALHAMANQPEAVISGLLASYRARMQQRKVR